MSCPPGGFAVLTSLGRLARLALKDNSHTPACLPQLTSLEELCLDEASLDPGEAVAALNEALQHLTAVSMCGLVLQHPCCWGAALLRCCPPGMLHNPPHTPSYPCCLQLTSLCIIDDPERCQPPATISGLSRLQRCCLGSAKFDPAELSAQLAPLPPGPWAASLRELGASMDVLPHSLAMLSAATQLTRLAVTGGSYEHSDALWEWARSHPTLQQLQLDILKVTQLSGATLHAICSLAHERPELTVVTVLYEEGSTFDDEFGIELIC